ncbi:MAG: hypothetical protein WBE48_07800 [Xanthobacteraceae bacterium]
MIAGLFKLRERLGFRAQIETVKRRGFRQRHIEDRIIFVALAIATFSRNSAA